jgi:uncharacterized protein (DUF433 family)
MTGERVTVNPKVMGGAPVIRGTRVPVQTIIASLAGGDDVAYVAEQFLLTEEDVRAALEYAAKVLDEIAAKGKHRKETLTSAEA